MKTSEKKKQRIGYTRNFSLAALGERLPKQFVKRKPTKNFYWDLSNKLFQK